MLERMWSKANTQQLLVGMQTCTTTWKLVWWFLRILGINLPQDLAKPLFDIYPKDDQSYYKDICSTMFMVAFFL